MNQTDYKKIAEIIKERYTAIFFFNDMTQGSRKSSSDIAYALADYFETKNVVKEGFKDITFDREQFLKDCGVTQ